MSDSSTQDKITETPLSPSSETPDVPAKKATKKTAKKTATKTAKKAAKKTATKAAKKTATKATKKSAKKTAKKAAKKSAQPNDSVQEQMLFTSAPAPAPVAEPQAQPPASTPVAPTNTAPVSKPTVQAPPSPAPESNPSPKTENASDQPIIGRVKGLGPIRKKDRESNENDRPRDNQHHNQRDQQRDNRDDNRGDQRKDNRRDNRRGKRRSNDNRRSNQDSADRPSDNKDNRQGNNRRNNRNNRNNPQKRTNQQHRERPQKRPVVFTGDPVEVNGMLELAPKGFGFLRVPDKKFEQCQKDVFVPPDIIRTQGLRVGVWIHGIAQEGPRGLQLTKITAINDLPPEEAFKLPHFEELKAVNPNRRIAFETTPDRFTTRILDIISPVGRGQRGLIVSPPRSGKTTILLHMAEAIQEKYSESIHLIILLVDERPEEVTEFRRALPNAEIYASSNDDPARNHARMAELCIERAKRLVEGNQDVLILMDSITRLARAYNNGSGDGGHKQKGKNRGYQSGGIVAGALEMPRRIFAAARNTRNAGSLTILATALIQTNSRADEVIFQEFKGTGNMELVLDRRIAEQYIYPAVDIFKSGTRREELIMAEHQLHKINLIRRGLSGHRPEEAMERLLFFLKKFPNNAQMLLEIKG